MKIMVVGGGGREHAIIKKIKQSPLAEEIYALPGNAGMRDDAICVNIGAKDLDGIVAFAKEKQIDYAIVAPDDPLVLGAVDRLNEIGIPCFGPKAEAAIIEGSKIFSKNLMKMRVASASQSATHTSRLTTHNSFPSVLRRYVLELVVVSERAAKEVSSRAVVFCNKVKCLGVGGE